MSEAGGLSDQKNKANPMGIMNKNIHCFILPKPKNLRLSYNFFAGI